MSVYYVYALKVGGGQPMMPSSLSLPKGHSLSSFKPSLGGCFKRRNSFTELIWKWISFGRCFVYAVSSPNGELAHRSLLIGPNFKFPFLDKGEFEIGPCYTEASYRGQGIYPYVIRHIAESEPKKRFMMLVSEDNASSIRGIEKAGFLRVGKAYRKKGRWAYL